MVPVTAIAQTPRNTTAPADSGWTIEPTIVAAKIAKSRHDAWVMPSGGPNQRMTSAMANTATQRQIRAGGCGWTAGCTGIGVSGWG